MITERAGHASEIVRQAGLEHDAVFVLGGDGTVMEVVSVLAGTDRPVGVLPGGTGNLLAGALGIPASVPRAVQALLAGDVHRIDLARFSNGDYFAVAAGLGIDAAMVAATAATAWKRRFGLVAYVWTAARAALVRDEFELFADVDDTPVRARASLAMVANSGTLFRGLMLLGPDISTHDGTLDLCVFSPSSAQDVFGIIWRVMRKDFRPHPRMRFWKGKRIRLASDPPRAVQADGELVGVTPVEIEVAPGAAALLIPRH